MQLMHVGDVKKSRGIVDRMEKNKDRTGCGDREMSHRCLGLSIKAVNMLEIA